MAQHTNVMKIYAKDAGLLGAEESDWALPFPRVDGWEKVIHPCVNTYGYELGGGGQAVGTKVTWG
jgi:hypothetical protein